MLRQKITEGWGEHKMYSLLHPPLTAVAIDFFFYKYIVKSAEQWSLRAGGVEKCHYQAGEASAQM